MRHCALLRPKHRLSAPPLPRTRTTLVASAALRPNSVLKSLRCRKTAPVIGMSHVGSSARSPEFSHHASPSLTSRNETPMRRAAPRAWPYQLSHSASTSLLMRNETQVRRRRRCTRSGQFSRDAPPSLLPRNETPVRLRQPPHPVRPILTPRITVPAVAKRDASETPPAPASGPANSHATRHRPRCRETRRK